MERQLIDIPPLPPVGVFDVRFSTNRMVEGVLERGTNELPIMVASAAYPVTVEWTIKNPAVQGSLIIGKEEQLLRSKGTIRITSAEENLRLRMVGKSGIPGSCMLYQNYPNPFNPSTHITYSLTRPDIVHLRIYNILGQVVATVVNEKEAPGTYDQVWRAERFGSGVYFYRLDAGTFSQIRKMLLLK